VHPYPNPNNPTDGPDVGYQNSDFFGIPNLDRVKQAVYDAFDGEDGFEDRLEALLAALEAGDLGALPPNDLVSSPIADELRAAGAFRAGVTGAGPAVYGLFTERDRAAAARELFTDRCETWLTAPAW